MYVHGSGKPTLNKRLQLITAIALLLCALLPVVVADNPTTTVSLELINAYGMSAGEIDTYLGLLQEQGITTVIYRLNAMNEYPLGTSTGLNAAKNFIETATTCGISVSIDLHTWYTTWDENFDDSAGDYETQRDDYLTYVSTVLNAFDAYDVRAFMVLNEPAAQTASTEENNFILEIISTAKAATDKPISVRFMAGYSPTTGHYASSIDSATDFLCRNSYWDPQEPETAVYGCSESTLTDVVTQADSLSKDFWITEFGYSNANETTQAAYVAAFVAWGIEHEIDELYCWTSQPEYTDENYDIFDGYTPRLAFYELVGEDAAPTTTPTPTAAPTTAPTAIQASDYYPSDLFIGQLVPLIVIGCFLAPIIMLVKEKNGRR